jgi:hypothetical protein
MSAMDNDSFELEVYTYHSYELRQLQLEMYGDSLRHVRYRSHLDRVKPFFSSEMAVLKISVLSSLLNLLRNMSPCSTEN